MCKATVYHRDVADAWAPHSACSNTTLHIYRAMFFTSPFAYTLLASHHYYAAEDDSEHDEDEDGMEDGANEGPSDRFASLLAQLAGPRLHAAMGGGGGGGGTYDRLLKGLGSSKPYEQQGALEEISQVCRLCCSG